MSDEKKCWKHITDDGTEAEQKRQNRTLNLRRAIADIPFAELDITCGGFLSFLKIMDECHAHGEATIEDIKIVEGLVEKMLKRREAPPPKSKKSRPKKKPKESA